MIWDKNISALRSLQAAFSEGIKPLLTQASCTRWLSSLNSLYPRVLNIGSHFIDHCNIECLKWDRDKRVKKMNIIARQISKYNEDPEHNRLYESALAGAEKFGCPASDLSFDHLEYPEDIEW